MPVLLAHSRSGDGRGRRRLVRFADIYSKHNLATHDLSLPMALSAMYATVLPPHASASIRFLMHAPTPTGTTLTCGQPGPTSKRCGDVGPIDRSVAEAATPPTGHTRCQGPSPASQLPARQTATAANVDHPAEAFARSASSLTQCWTPPMESHRESPPAPHRLFVRWNH